MTSDEIRFQLETAALVRLHRGVYGIGGAPRTREQRWSAAVLACGPTAALSHLSAAALWALTATDPVVIDTSIGGRGKRTRRGVRVHRPSRLEPEDITDHQGIRTTTVDRTLIDLAVVVSTRTLERLLDEAQHLKLLDTDISIRPSYATKAESGSRACVGSSPATNLGAPGHAASWRKRSCYLPVKRASHSHWSTRRWARTPSTSSGDPTEWRWRPIAAPPTNGSPPANATTGATPGSTLRATCRFASHTNR